MVGRLTTICYTYSVITHDNKLKTDEFGNVHYCASAVRHVGEEKHQFK